MLYRSLIKYFPWNSDFYLLLKLNLFMFGPHVLLYSEYSKLN